MSHYARRRSPKERAKYQAKLASMPFIQRVVKGVTKYEPDMRYTIWDVLALSALTGKYKTIEAIPSDEFLSIFSDREIYDLLDANIIVPEQRYTIRYHFTLAHMQDFSKTEEIEVIYRCQSHMALSDLLVPSDKYVDVSSGFKVPFKSLNVYCLKLLRKEYAAWGLSRCIAEVSCFA